MVFTPEHNAFILKAHYRSGTANEDGTWTYSLRSCRDQFDLAFPKVDVTYKVFTTHRSRIIKRFEGKNCICKGKSTGRPSISTKECVGNNIQQQPDVSPKSLGKLSVQTASRSALPHCDPFTTQSNNQTESVNFNEVMEMSSSNTRITVIKEEYGEEIDISGTVINFNETLEMSSNTLNTVIKVEEPDEDIDILDSVINFNETLKMSSNTLNTVIIVEEPDEDIDILDSVINFNETLEMTSNTLNTVIKVEEPDEDIGILDSGINFNETLEMSSSNTLTTVIKVEEPDIKEEPDEDIDHIDISDTVIVEDSYDYADLADSAKVTLDELVKNAEYSNELCMRKSGKKLRQRVCPLCKKVFVNNYLRFHLQAHDEFKDIRNKNIPKHVCSICNQTFREKAYLDGHIRKHTGEKPYKCNECGERFTFRTCRWKHLNLYADCAKACNSKSSLKKHLAKHKEKQ